MKYHCIIIKLKVFEKNIIKLHVSYKSFIILLSLFKQLIPNFASVFNRIHYDTSVLYFVWLPGIR